MGRFCANCGGAIEEGVQFCPECGTPVISAENSGVSVPAEPPISTTAVQAAPMIPQQQAPMYGNNMPPAGMQPPVQQPYQGYGQPRYGQPQGPQPYQGYGLPVQKKSMAVALILTFLFGPLGMLYVNVKHALILIGLAIVGTLLTDGLAGIGFWIASMVWASIDVNEINAGRNN